MPGLVPGIHVFLLEKARFKLRELGASSGPVFFLRAVEF
jgi:hypothetical protein